MQIRWSVEGYAEEYSWSLAVTGPGRKSAPVELELLPGAAIEGSIVGGGRAGSGGETEVCLEPAITEGATSIERRRLRLLKRCASPSPDEGGFRFGELRPGTYVVSVRDELSQTEHIPVEIGEFGAHVLLDPVRLRRPRTVSIQLEPAQAPAGARWLVELVRIGSSTSRVRTQVRQPADWAGFLTLDGIEDGRYLLNVRDPQGGLWSHRELIVEGDQEVYSKIESVRFRGRITSGDDGLPWALAFGSTQGTLTVRVQADEYGYLEGIVPREGRFVVERLLPERACPTCLAAEVVGSRIIPVSVIGEVDIEKGPSGWATVRIELPDTRLQVRVVRDNGDPVERASNVAPADVDVLRVDGTERSLRREALLSIDETGVGELVGILPGPLQIHAVSADRQAESEWVTVDVREGVDQKVELRLSTRRALGLQLVGELGPVPGATIHAVPALPAGRFSGFWRIARSGPDGGATLQVLATVNHWDVIVNAPGYAVSMIRLAPAWDRVTTLHLDRRPGRLTISGGTSSAPEAPETIAHRGAELPLSSVLERLRNLASIEDGVLVLEGLEPGVYTLCVPSQGEARCSSAEVPPFGRASIVAGRDDR